MLVVGFFAYILRKLNFDLAPLIIAFVLAEPVEYTLSQTMLYAKGSILQYIFVTRPISSAFLLSALIWILYRAMRSFSRKRT